MTAAFTILSLGFAAYRIRKGLFTKPEWLLLAIWAAHFLLESVQLVSFASLSLHRPAPEYFYSARFMCPADFLTWGWLAWGIVRLKRLWKYALAAGALVVVYDAVLLVKPKLPVGRRGAYVAAANWAAEKIRADWAARGEGATGEYVFDLGEYRTAARPVVDCHTARVAYLVGGRSNGIAEGDPKHEDARLEKLKTLDEADYWIQDLRTDDSPGADWELMDTFRRGKYVLPLYRRIRK